MEDLLKSQIQESCRLALPEGLRDLMADISREVLRAQPENLYLFISKYLSALLVTRNQLKLASSVCADVCNSTCFPHLDTELKAIGLSDDDVGKAIKIVERHFFKKKNVNEGTLVEKLTSEIDIQENQVEELMKAIRQAFLRQKVQDMSCLGEPEQDDKVSNAVAHTISHYDDRVSAENICNTVAALKIQTAYEKYKIKKQVTVKRNESRNGKRKLRFNASEHVDDDTSETPDSLKSLAGSYVVQNLDVIEDDDQSDEEIKQDSMEKHVLIDSHEPLVIDDNDVGNDGDDENCSTVQESIAPESIDLESIKTESVDSLPCDGFTLRAVASESMKELELLKHSF